MLRIKVYTVLVHIPTINGRQYLDIQNVDGKINSVFLIGAEQIAQSIGQVPALQASNLSSMTITFIDESGNKIGENIPLANISTGIRPVGIPANKFTLPKFGNGISLKKSWVQSSAAMPAPRSMFISVVYETQ